MTSTAPEAGSTPAPKNLLARFVGIIVAPKDTYASVVVSPKWFGVLAVCAVAMALMVGGYLLTPIGQNAWLAQVVDSRAAMGRPMEPQQVQGMERIAPYVGYFAALQFLVFMPLVSLAIAGILFAVFNAALGGNATFKQVFSVVAHAGPVGVLSQAFAMPINYMRGTLTGVANLGVLFPMLDERSFLSHFLGMVDLFLVWQLVVLAMGFAVLYRRRTQPIAFSFLSVYAVIAVGFALWMSRGGA